MAAAASHATSITAAPARSGNWKITMQDSCSGNAILKLNLSNCLCMSRYGFRSQCSSCDLTTHLKNGQLSARKGMKMQFNVNIES